jgi:photosystem II stability/assembly factor-like uncharacterized protein
MKKLYTFVGLLCLCQFLPAQFQWKPTGGPEGLGSFETYYNKDFAFLYDNFQLYRTGDGQSWEIINTTQAAKIEVSENKMSIYREQDKGNNIPKEIQFLLSADNGETWYNAPVPQGAYFNPNQIMLCSHGIYFKAGEKLYRSQTDGQSWKQVSYDSIAFSSLFSSNDKIFGRDGENVYEFNFSSGKWVYTWKAPPTNTIKDVYVDGSNIITLGTNFYYASSNNGETWKTYGASASLNSYFIKKDNKVFFQNGPTLRYTENGGQNWKIINLNGNYQQYCLFQNKFLLFSNEGSCFLFDDVNNSYLQADEGLVSSAIKQLWTGKDQIWAQAKSNNKLYTLDLSSGVWSPSVLPPTIYSNITLLSSNSGYLLYTDATIDNILYSLDKGSSWDTLDLPYNSISELRQVYWLGDLIYIEGQSKHYISKDLGATWSTLFKRLNSPVFFQNKIWSIGSFGYLLVSADQGISWTEVDPGVKHIMSLIAADDRIFAITHLINYAERDAMYTSENGVDWKYSGDGSAYENTIGSFILGGKIWKHGGIYFSHHPVLGFYYSLDDGSSWEQIKLSDSYLTTFTSLKDSVYVGHDTGGGVLSSPVPQFERPFAKGSIFNDYDKDGIKDPNETNLTDVQIMVSTNVNPQKNYFTLSNQEGQFEIRPSLQSNDTLRANILSEYVESIEPPFYIINDSIEQYDFAVHFRPNVRDGKISGKFNILPFSGDQINAFITYHNKGTVPVSGEVGLKLDPGFLFIKSFPAPSEIINSDSLVYHFEDLAISGRNEILIEGRLSPAVPAGTFVGISGTLLLNGPDINLSDNQFFIEDNFALSPLPVSKSVIPADGLRLAEIMEGKELEYTIRFQNPLPSEVNSVQISDKLSSNFDFKSIRIVGSSHAITKWELLPSGILRVFFDNMNLAPVNSDYRQSLGFFSFAIRIKTDKNDMFPLSNTANIIFENVRTITTNSVLTQILPPVVLSAEHIEEESLPKLSIIPNPASQNCFLNTNGRMKGAGTIRIFNANGQVLSSQQLQDLSLDIEIQTAQLSNGFYLITAEGVEGIMHGKLIIQK